MSADNWTACPKCDLAHARKVADEEKRVADLYGTVPVDEFDAARHALAAMRAEKREWTFREDYEFYGAEDGLVVWSYKGRCNVCGAHAETTGSVEVTS